MRTRKSNIFVLGWSTVRVRRSQCESRSGLSLLEVVLALAILAMSATMLAQLSSQATNSALTAQRLAHAQILCESKMAEVLAGAIPMSSMDWTMDNDGTVPGEWYYKLETSTTERQNMVGLRLSVSNDPQIAIGNPEVFFIVRWVIDPQLGLDILPSTTGESATSTSSTGASTSAMSSSSGASASGGIQ